MTSYTLRGKWRVLILRAPQLVKDPPAIEETQFDPWVGKTPLEEGKATHSSVLAWRIPRTL